MTISLVMLSLLFVLAAYRMGGRILVSPFFVASVMYLISIVVAALNLANWRVAIVPQTVILISCGLGALGVGELFARYSADPALPSPTPKTFPVYRVSPFTVSILSAFSMLTLLVYALETYRLASMFGVASGFGSMLWNSRQVKFTGYSVSPLVGHMYSMSQAISCVLMLMFLNNRILCGRAGKSERLMLIPVVCFCLTSILSTGRTQLMYQVITFLVLAAVMVYRRNGWVGTDNGTMARVAAIAVSLFAIAFIWLGEARSSEASKGVASLLETASIYVGSSVAALNQYVQRAPNEDGFWGSHTLFGLYSFLRSFGYGVPELSPPLEMTYFSSELSTNVYTPLRRYLEDFGLAGVVLCMFLIGLFYGGMLRRIQRSRDDRRLVIFAALYYPIVEIAIEERLFMDVITTGTLYSIVYIYAVYYLVARRGSPGNVVRRGHYAAERGAL